MSGDKITTAKRKVRSALHEAIHIAELMKLLPERKNKREAAKNKEEFEQSAKKAIEEGTDLPERPEQKRNSKDKKNQP